MSVFELEGSEATTPFAAAHVITAVTGRPTEAARGALDAPFAESMEHDPAGEVDAAEVLRSELADEAFEEALEALADEAAARHLRAGSTWSPESEVPVLGTSELEQWLESLAAESDRVLGVLETHFADRPVESLQDGELESVSGYAGPDGTGFASPMDAQEQFLKSLVNKAKKVARGVAKIAKKGVSALGKILPLGRLFAMLRRLVRPLLRRVLGTAIGRLPAALRPLATKLATRFGGAGESADPQESIGESFDRLVTELALAPNEAVPERGLAELEAEAGDSGPGSGEDPQHALDVARARLTRELVTVPAGEPPTAQLQQFIPAVMAAMPLIRTGVRIVGRQRVVGVVAAAIAQLIKGMVGDQAAQQLSRHIADTGLKVLGLEAEHGVGTLGTEALAAAAEDTVRDVMALSPEAFADDRLLEAEVQRAFTEAAAQHLPATVLRPEIVERESGDEHAFWVMMPRATRPRFRYKKYGRVIPVRITRPAARAVVLSGGETLEHQLLDEGASSWPVGAELEVYELLDGSALGHLAAFESEDQDDVAATTTEFEELTETAAAVLAGNPRLAAAHPAGRRRRRYYRLRVAGRPLRRHRVVSLRLDLTAARPVLTVHVHVGEREAHAIAAHLEGSRMPQVLAVLRGVLGSAARRVIATRVQRMLRRRAVPTTPDAAGRLAQRLAEAMLQAVSQQLPAAAPALSTAAKDAASGLTLSFAFTFDDARSLAGAAPGQPTLSIRPGVRGE